MSPGPYTVVFSSSADDRRAAPRTGEDDPPRVFYLAPSPGQTIAQAVYLSGFFQPPVLCSGLARCGRCRMLVELGAPKPLPVEKAVFSSGDIEKGWRLACRHKAVEGMRLILPEGTRLYGGASLALPGKSVPDVLFSGQKSVAASRYALAVDFGTTTVHWRLLEVPKEKGQAAARILWENSAVNPQMGAGSDVVSRLGAALQDEGSKRLRDLFLDGLRRLLEKSKKYLPAATWGRVSALCLAANPAMTCLALGSDIRGLAHAPYSLPARGGDWVQLEELPPMWLPPQLSPFVGGDISAGYAAIAFTRDRPPPVHPFLLADLGTNGEFLLVVSPDKAFAASVALGPALEGTGLSHGTEARPGAVSAFTLSPGGLEARTLEGLSADGREPSVCPGITGTGYISLLSILLTAGVLDREGAFTPGTRGPLRRFLRLSPQTGDGGQSLELPMGLRLPASDVEELLKVKAAFSLGLQRLLDRAGVPTASLAKVYIAGALGLHADKHALEELGFLPQGMAARVETVGNSSLDGAALLLQHGDARQALVEWAGKVESLELARDDAFLREFPHHMRFSWKARDDNS